MTTTWLFPSLVATLASSLLLTFIYFYLNRHEPDKALKIWAFSWMVYSLRFIFMLFILYYGKNSVLLIGNQMSALVFGLLLLWGACLWADRRMSLVWIIIFLLVAIWIPAATIMQFPLVLLSLPTFIYLGVISIWTGILILQNRKGVRIGAYLTGWTLIIWGIHKIDYPFLRSIEWFAPWGFLIGALLALTTSIGILLLYFEKTRLSSYESQAHYRRLAENNPMLICQFLQDGEITYANEAYCSYFEKTAEELVGSSFLMLIPEEDRDSVIANFSGLSVEKSIHSYDHRVIIPGGEVRWQRWTDMGLFDSQGRIVSYQSIGEDITSRKRVEDALERSERRASTLLEAIPDMVFQLDSQGVYLNFKADLSDLYTQSVDNIIGKKNRDIMPSYFADLVDRKIKQTLESGKMQTFEYQLPVPGQNEVDYEARMIKSGENRVTAIVRNVTELKLAEEALQQAHNELEERVKERSIELKKAQEQLLHGEKLAVIGNLSATITHELSNPLHGVMAVLKGLQRRVELDEKDTRLVELAITECDRMKNLLRNLQGFNRPSSGKIVSINIHTLIDSILLLVENKHRLRKVIIRTVYTENMPRIKAVDDQLKQVILNLLSNAVHSCDGGDTVTISTAVIAEEKISIKIRDTGKGIKSDHIAKIFDPFFTTKPEKKGTGLGLSISYGIIKKHGGQLDLESEFGRGTTFTITLPIKGVNNA